MAGLYAVGARAYVIESPSMGPAAPVGSLVVVLPVEPASAVVGDIVAFHPSEPSVRVHVHRVVSASAVEVRTRGDLNVALDPWPLTPATLIGRVFLVLPAAGWGLRALPLLLAAALIGAAVARATPPAHRGPALLGVWSLALVSISVVLHPWTGAEPLPDRAPRTVRVVSTGLLPQRVQALASQGGKSVVLGSAEVRYGQTAIIELPSGHDGTSLQLRARPEVLPWSWAP